MIMIRKKNKNKPVSLFLLLLSCRFYYYFFLIKIGCKACFRESKGAKARVKTMIKSRNLTTDFYFISQLMCPLTYLRKGAPRVKISSLRHPLGA
jgi:hypothetical protein